MFWHSNWYQSFFDRRIHNGGPNCCCRSRCWDHLVWNTRMPICSSLSNHQLLQQVRLTSPKRDFKKQAVYSIWYLGVFPLHQSKEIAWKKGGLPIPTPIFWTTLTFNPCYRRQVSLWRVHTASQPKGDRVVWAQPSSKPGKMGVKMWLLLLHLFWLLDT